MYLTFAASLRRDSFNLQLIQWVNRFLQENGSAINAAAFSDYEAPLYNFDNEASSGLPQGAQHFVEATAAAKAVVIASPEYNFSIGGPLKNLIDWASRAKPNPFPKKPVLLLAASPSLVGGHRGLWQTRIPLEGLGAFVYPDMFCLASAHEAFDANGQFKDAALQSRLENVLTDFHAYAQRLS